MFSNRWVRWSLAPTQYRLSVTVRTQYILKFLLYVTFIAAPMVHWPEAMVTFDTTNGALFSADAFGSFIALE